MSAAITPETLGLPSTLVAKITFEQDVNDLLEILAEDGVDLSTLTRSDVIEIVRNWAVEQFNDGLYNQVEVHDAATGENLMAW